MPRVGIEPRSLDKDTEIIPQKFKVIHLLSKHSIDGAKKESKKIKLLKYVLKIVLYICKFIKKMLIKIVLYIFGGNTKPKLLFTIHLKI